VSDAAGRLFQGGHAPPAWPAPVKHHWWKHLEIKIVIAVLIGLVSVTGAVLTWKANQFDENATDNDRLAIAQTVQLRQTEATVDARVRDEELAFEQFRQLKTDAASLHSQADDLRKQVTSASGSGATTLSTLAQSADTQAAQLEAQANTLSTDGFNPNAVTLDANKDPVAYDTTARRESLFIETKQTPDFDPTVTAHKAVELRQKGQRLSGLAIFLVGAVVLLTFAQLSRKKKGRNALLGMAMAVYAVSTVLVFVGG
jgi:hypothetical protein